jgi:hypothetical protein
MSILKEMVSKLFSSAFQIFKEYGASNADIKDGIKDAKDMLKKLKFDDESKMNDILTVVDSEVKKLDFNEKKK